MAITRSRLRTESRNSVILRVKTAESARSSGIKTAFLCHSHNDKDLAEGLVNLLARDGWNVYIDWKDTSLPAVPDATTAQAIKDRIDSCNVFLFLATPDSTGSRWCPWEIGYADKSKGRGKVWIVPTEENGTIDGSEYLGLYHRVSPKTGGELGVFPPNDKNGYDIKSVSI